MTKISKNFQSATDDPNALLNFLGDPAWVRHCRPVAAADGSGKHHSQGLPAGVTYLSQLMAHDMFLTEPCRNTFVPNTSPRADQSRVNLVQHPLMLETVYGRTGAADSVLYDQENPDKFDLLKYEYFSEPITIHKLLQDPRRRWTYPVLADARNFSSPMLAQITLNFMIFHNRLVDEFKSKGYDKKQLFSLARGTAIRTWHNIIKNDILKTTCREADDTIFPSWMGELGVWTDKEFLSRDVLRCFHGLVRDGYIFNEKALTNVVKHEGIDEILSASNIGPSVAVSLISGSFEDIQKVNVSLWLDKWEVGWEFFFDTESKDDAASRFRNRTGFTPSFAFSRKSRDKDQKIQVRDAKKSKTSMSDRLVGCSILEPFLEELETDLNNNGGCFALKSGQSLPVAVALLAESFYDFKRNPKDVGKLGRLGSAIVRRQIEPVIDQAQAQVGAILNRAEITTVPTTDVLPNSFTQMIGLTDFNFIKKGAH